MEDAFGDVCHLTRRSPDTALGKAPTTWTCNRLLRRSAIGENASALKWHSPNDESCGSITYKMRSHQTTALSNS